MVSETYVKWFDDLLKRFELLPKHKVGTGLAGSVHTGFHHTGYRLSYNPSEAREWATEAESALAAVFPQGHPTRRGWEAASQSSQDKVDYSMGQLIGVFRAAFNQIRDGRIGSLVAAIRADTEAELLDQAEALLNTHSVAAVVIAGGALETHLRHLVSNNSLAVSGAGSIDKYDGAIAQARNGGNEVYSANLSKYVKAWGGMRNDAAHSPGEFRWTEDDVRRMIEGVRDFIDRTTPR